MLIYWTLFGYFGFGALIGGSGSEKHQKRSHILLAFSVILIAILVGFRYRVGGDWGAYERMFALAGYADLERILSLADPGYEFLNWAAQQLGAGIWLVNLICGLTFSWGLYRLVVTQPDPWLSMLLAIPYFVIVVAMGYSRQAMAIGILMAGFAQLIRGKSIIRFSIYVAIATLFHRTAIVALPLGALTGERGTLINVLVAAGAGLLMYDAFVASSADLFISNYVKSGVSSQGAVVRISQSALPALIFLSRWKYFGFGELERKLWRNLSVASIACVFALMVFRSSTFIDRLGLYLIPLQITVLPRFLNSFRPQYIATMAAIIYAAMVQFVWLNFADNAHYWVPYRFYLGSVQ